MKLSYILISLWFYIVAVIVAFTITPLALIVWLFSLLFDRKFRLLHFITILWASAYVWFNPFWKVKVTGRNNIPKQKKFIIVSNHQSMVDIIVMFRLNIFFKWVSKEENFKIPFIGWMLTLNKHVKLRRGSQSSIKRMLKDCSSYLDKKIPVIIFPEGTRSETGEMRKFKDGAFHVAKNSEAAILPVVLENTGKAIPKKGFILRGVQRIEVKILEEISEDFVREMDIKELKNHTFSLMQNEIEKFRNK